MTVTDAMTMTLLVTGVLTFYLLMSATVDLLRNRRMKD